MRWLVFVLAILMQFSVAHAEEIRPEQLEYRYFKISKGAGYSGRQTDFSVQVFANGTAIYEGGKGNKEVGFRVFRVEPDVFQQVSDLLASDKFRAFGETPCLEHEFNGMDHGMLRVIEDRTRVTQYKRDGWRPKVVKAKSFCPAKKEAVFIELFKEVSKLVGVKRLTGSYEEQEKLFLCDAGARECGLRKRERWSKAAPTW